MALVQQLLLWFPEDTRLLWLLGELYNASGEMRAADQVFDDCVVRAGSKKPDVAEHRRAVKAAIAAQVPVETPRESFLPNDVTFWTVGLGVGAGHRRLDLHAGSGIMSTVWWKSPAVKQGRHNVELS